MREFVISFISNFVYTLVVAVANIILCIIISDTSESMEKKFTRINKILIYSGTALVIVIVIARIGLSVYNLIH